MLWIKTDFFQLALCLKKRNKNTQATEQQQTEGTKSHSRCFGIDKNI